MVSLILLDTSYPISVIGKILIRFQDSVKQYGFKIDAVTIGTAKADAQTEKSLQANINEQQLVETALIKSKRAAIENADRLKKSEVDKQEKINRAQGEAEANRIVNKSLNGNIIDYRKIEKWNGTLPKTTGGAVPFVDVDK